MQQFKGEAPEEIADVKVDLPIDAHLPLEYVGGERLRLEMYRKIADAKTPERLTEVQAEMRDRYGTPPEPVANLFAVARFRLLVRVHGLTDVSLQGRHVRFGPMPLPDSRQLRLKRLLPGRGIQGGGRAGLGAPPHDAAGRWRAAARHRPARPGPRSSSPPS